MPTPPPPTPGLPTAPDVSDDPAGLKVLGVTGINEYGGRIAEERHPKLRGGLQAVRVYEEMSQNDDAVSAMLHAIKTTLMGVEWRVQPAAEDDPDATKWAEFTEQCLTDMSHTFDDMLADVYSCLPYGWSYFEVVYKRRGGAVEDPEQRSAFSDGLYGWRKIQLRKQSTLYAWAFDDDGGLRGMWQQPAPTSYHRSSELIFLPIERCLLFRHDPYAGNPEGRSALRGAYVAWTRKDALCDLQLTGYERDLVGLPVLTLPGKLLSEYATPEERRTRDAYKKFVSNVRRNALEGVVLPAEVDEEGKSTGYRFSLMSSGGTRALNIDAGIDRQQMAIVRTLLAEFIMMGQQGGSYAMHADKTDIFTTSLRVILQRVAAVLNRFAVPRLLALNGVPPELYPTLVPGEVAPPDLAKFAQYLASASSSGMLTYDRTVERAVREVGGLPDLDEDTSYGDAFGAEGAPGPDDAPTQAQMEEGSNMPGTAEQDAPRTAAGTPPPKTPAPDAAAAPGGAPSGSAQAQASQGASIAQVSLNGAQVTSLLQVLQAVANCQLPRDSALALIVSAFAVDEASARAMLGPMGTDAFTPAPPSDAEADFANQGGR